MEEQLKAELNALKQEVKQLRQDFNVEKARDKIVVVGSVDSGDDIPVFVNGKRRKIVTSAP